MISKLTNNCHVSSSCTSIGALFFGGSWNDIFFTKYLCFYLWTKQEFKERSVVQWLNLNMLAILVFFDQLNIVA